MKGQNLEELTVFGLASEKGLKEIGFALAFCQEWGECLFLVEEGVRTRQNKRPSGYRSPSKLGRLPAV